MTIECPQCQEKCELSAAPIPPDGVEISCAACGLTFRIRSHQVEADPGPGPRRQEAAAATPAAVAASESSPAPPPAEDDGFPGRIFLLKDEMPFWMAAAYGEGRAPAAAPEPPAEPENSFLARKMREHAEEPPRDIPILIDENVAEEELPEEPSALPPVSPPQLAGQAAARRKVPRRDWKRIGIGLALCALIVAIVLLGRFIWGEVRDRLGNLTGKAVSALHSDADEKRKLQFSDLNHEYVSRGKKENSLFVIEGKVTNHLSQACHSVQVKGTLFDERGKQATEGTAYCGNVLKKEEIQSYPPEKIQKALQNVYGTGLSNFNIDPGGSIRFMLVFFDPPEKVSEFSVEVTDYKPKGPETSPEAK